MILGTHDLGHCSLLLREVGTAVDRDMSTIIDSGICSDRQHHLRHMTMIDYLSI